MFLLILKVIQMGKFVVHFRVLFTNSASNFFEEILSIVDILAYYHLARKNRIIHSIRLEHAKYICKYDRYR